MYSVTEETAILPLQKQHILEKNEFAFSFRLTWKDQQGAGNMLMIHVNLNMKRIGIILKGSSDSHFPQVDMTI